MDVSVLVTIPKQHQEVHLGDDGYPAVTVDLMLPTWDCDAGSCTTEVYHAAVHPNGDSMTMENGIPI